MSGIATFQSGGLRVQGFSSAGVETWFRVHPTGLAFDAGHGPVQLAGARELFLSHGHLDHALGVPFMLSQRTRHHGESTRVYCPRAIVDRLSDLITAAERLEETRYRYEIHGLVAGERVDVARGVIVEAFATDHVLPSLGYHLLRRRHHLREEFRGLPGSALAALREAGTATEVVAEEIALAFCGDTGPAVFTLEPRVFEAEVLLLECTFLAPEHRSHGELYKHLHLEDLVAHAERFQNRHLVLHHLSRRYALEDFRAAVRERLPALADRIHLWGEEQEIP